MFDKSYRWLNPPRHDIKDGKLIVFTSPETDFWQRTHYGFQKDNGHCYIKKVNYNFSVTVRTESYPDKQYDQCGLIVRIDGDNWIKASMEYENTNHYRLGSVVTNNGFSDWATLDIKNKTVVMWYRIQNNENDFLIEYSSDGKDWNQLRITHLFNSFSYLQVGIYACSPMDSSFTAIFDNYKLEKSNWK